MIRPEQLAEALQRLEPRDRELLSLSLHRRVPDEALARLYGYETAEISRRRAAAIERLADDLRVQRGEDLGSVLKALLEPGTWSGIEMSAGREFEPSGPRAPRPVARGNQAVNPSQEPEPPPAPVPLRPVPSPPEPVPEPEPTPLPAASAKDTPVEEAPPSPPAGLPKPAEPREPVLDMLSDRKRERDERAGQRLRRGILALAALGAAALLGAAGLMAATQLTDNGSGSSPNRGNGDGTRNFVPAKGGPLAAPFASDPKTSSCYSTAYLKDATVLFKEPGGEPRLRLTRLTEWGSPRVLGIVGQRGDWLGVQASELKNGEVAWIPRERARVDCVRWSMHADLSKRRLFVRRDGHTVKEMKIAIGSPGHSTPQGRFSVTDKLRVTSSNSPYGCCVLALNGHQTNLPEDWPGGDRLAVHATADVDSIGEPVSLGCMRVRSGEARWLIETIPLGAPIFIRP